ncbi:GH92 family glycosyl hydrolase [Amycolatopsis saalfeldensis]|uniref:Alpha-1,2-mannosidase, putative n=1 Tax=Amycolatopsis saalfeldensis TaxID=394193 RepID=A0A1H8UTS5_9PSEU|nr:GH92 family glycosyl hydrolase [Amycolatopsis saalfeldensis]SEP06571.1 alpha-1,2-mannosidase, putative [Amycolatopsis saalfeldensis]
MRYRFLAAVLATAVLGAPSVAAAAPGGAAAEAQLVSDPAAYVDPLIGTGSGGGSVGEINNFPGPAMPFGMMQFSPDTQGSYAGYQYHSDQIRGFSLDHASVGCTAFGDVPILPVTGDVGAAPWDRTEHFTHDGEQAAPGYYAVTLADSKVRAELTAGTRTGLAAFTFPAGANAQVLVKGGASLAGDSHADLKVTGDHEVSGSATTGNFCGKGNKYTVYYDVTFDQPFTAHGTWDGTSVKPGTDAVDSPKAGAYLTFGSQKVVHAKVSMSYVSVDGAKANMAAEIPGWDLGAVRQSTRDAWSAMLGKIRVAGKDSAQLKTFYTFLYHSLMHPNTFNDVDGRYIGFDDKIRTLPAGHAQYANFSDWDTYRTLAPLQAMLFPKQASDMAQSLTNDAVQGGWWPRWPMANDYTGQMTGDSSVALISSLYAFGARDFDVKTALKYLVKGATSVDGTPGAYQERRGVADYVARGYMPNNDASRGDHARVGASITLEWAIDDFAIAQFAQGIGDRGVAREFGKRGQNWQNIFNPATGYLQPRGEDGRFPDGPAYQPPPPGEFGQDGFDEGNAAQYTWLVPQDPAGLVTAMGGPAKTAARLDTFFQQLNVGPNEPYMWAGNEPDFGVPWLYNHVGQPWKTQQVVRQIATTQFSATPDGEPGNDDLGAQSSWYVWAALGIYPGTPGTSDLVVHSPLFERAVLTLPTGRTIDIRAPKASATTPYVQDLRLNGGEWNRTSLPAGTAHDGARLDFTLAAQPDRGWAAGSQPPSYRDSEQPFLASADNQLTAAPGSTGQATITGQRLGGHDRALDVTVQSPAGLTATAPRQLRLDDRTGGGSVKLTVSVPAGTPEGYYPVPVTVRGSGHTVTTSVIVLVAPKGGLTAAYGNVGISDDGDAGSANFDTAGNSLSRQALAAAGLAGGKTAQAVGTSFTWPAAPAGRPDNVVPAGQVITLAAPAGRLSFIGTATNGDHRATATVTFTDGTTAQSDLSFGDWVLPGGGTDPVFGNTLVARTAYRNQPGGQGGAASIYATAPFVAPAGKQVASVTLPAERDLHVFAVGLG